MKAKSRGNLIIASLYLILGPLIYFLSLMQVGILPYVAIVFPMPHFFLIHFLGLAMMYLGIAILMKELQKTNRQIFFRILLPSMMLWPIYAFAFLFFASQYLSYGIPIFPLDWFFPWYHLLGMPQLILYVITSFYTFGEYSKNERKAQMSSK